MDRANILSGAAFRSAVYGMFVFVLSLCVLGFAAHFYIKDTLEADLRSQIDSAVASLRAEYDSEGMEGLRGTVTRISPTFRETQRLAVLYDKSGQRVAGAQAVTPDFWGWTIRPVKEPGSGTVAQEYFLKAVRVADHTLIVGRDLQFIRNVEVAMARALLGLGGLMTLVSVGIGYVMSRRTQAKLERVGQTLEDVAQGDMSARIALSSANDQVDRISCVMNGHLDTLSALMAASKTSATSIAHDLKRPLSRAVLGLEKALNLAESGENPTEVIYASREELSKLTATFETILRIARIDADESAPLTATVDLPALLHDLGETYTVVAEESGQNLQVDLPSGEPVCVPGDLGMIAQLVVNLLQNAVSHGTLGNRITLSLLRDGNGAVIDVADTGPGIPAQDREKVLTAFYRSDAARATEGNGLGLALVKSIADRHGARLTLSDNKPGLKVTIRFTQILNT
ncbi:hypothetical protein P775_07820 [Puniceibacterium antarcticum]|uniref:histidine kinase n=1 Tax=Puniceibacterium antarcticum TaxID=1206336 RepID=A0A2G8RI62_9RHOB|nr:HAMP domain-containing sensor histidine kinase [Puniceibacterium antarcticum]PIL20768.1 hypothetical protein P775_07820 [Puniceibacterium antarcticum]